MPRRTSDEWPLRKLNLFAMPVAILLAIRADSFWWSALGAAAVGGVVAHVLAVLWVGRFREDLKRAGQTDSLSHLSAETRGRVNPSLQVRFIFMQGLSGALIGALWFAIAFGVVSLLT
jgi:hypothetical protein